MERIAQLTNLAFQFGPFLFALLFSLVITRWAYKIYKEANQRKDPRLFSFRPGLSGLPVRLPNVSAVT